jgi:hypothetical protein
MDVYDYHIYQSKIRKLTLQVKMTLSAMYQIVFQHKSVCGTSVLWSDRYVFLSARNGGVSLNHGFAVKAQYF